MNFLNEGGKVHSKRMTNHQTTQNSYNKKTDRSYMSETTSLYRTEMQDKNLNEVQHNLTTTDFALTDQLVPSHSTKSSPFMPVTNKNSSFNLRKSIERNQKPWP